MTYSIAARDPETGELGVAVQSRWPSVGAVVPCFVAGGQLPPQVTPVIEALEAGD